MLGLPATWATCHLDYMSPRLPVAWAACHLVHLSPGLPASWTTCRLDYLSYRLTSYLLSYMHKKSQACHAKEHEMGIESR